MPRDFAPILEPRMTSLVPPGDVLRGMFMANQKQGMRGVSCCVAVTHWRLLLQQVDRKLQPKAEPQIVSDRAALAAAELRGGGNGLLNGQTLILAATSLRLDVRSDDGATAKLMFMKGGSALTGGESQRVGVEALVALLAAARAPAP